MICVISDTGKSFSEPRKQKRQRRQQVIGRGKLTDPENGKLNSTGLTYGVSEEVHFPSFDV